MNEVYSRFSYGSLKSNVDPLYDTYNSVLSTLSNPEVYESTTTRDEGVYMFSLTKNWNGYFEYTPEGAFGVKINDLTPKKTSSVSLGRMYFYEGVEPDYMVVARYYNDDQYLSKINVAYDETTIIGVVRLEPRGYKPYTILFSFIKSNGVITVNKFHLALEDSVSDAHRFIYGYKEYQRDGLSYPLYGLKNDESVSCNVDLMRRPLERLHIVDNIISPKMISCIGVANLENHIFVANTSIKKLHSYKASTKTITNISTRQTRYDNNTELLKTFDYKFFIEGSNGKKNVRITSNDSAYFYYNEGVDGYVYLNSLKIDEYTIKSGNYIRRFGKNSLPMIKGSLSGSVNVIGCEGDNSFKIKCYRAYDDYFIGEYLLEFGKYDIPNLDVNTKYNIILFDLNGNLESKILSNRSPKPYNSNELQVYRPTSLNYNKITATSVYISWNFAGDVNSFLLYRSDLPIDITKLPQPFDEITLYSYNDNTIEINKVYYYMIAAKVADDDIRYSDNLKVLT